MAIFILENTIQKYDWGTIDAIPKLLGKKNLLNEPWAELWLGAHPKAPSVAVDIQTGTKTALDKLIATKPEAFLGKETAHNFDNSLPFLLKVLSAEKALSLQLHPSKLKAEKGYAREEFLGIPMDAAERNYKDSNHKPETVVALTRFEALCGFRPIDEIVNTIKLLMPKDWRQVAGRLADNPGKLELTVLFYTLITMQEIKKKLSFNYVKMRCRQIMDTASKNDKEYEIFAMISKLLESYPEDVGIFAPIALNLFKLKPWEAINLHSGQPHAYLKGTAVEIMANSDNVLRAGLTSKHKDASEFIASLSFESMNSKALQAEKNSDGFFVYPHEHSEYRISRMELDGQAENLHRTNSPEILLCLKGKLLLTSSSGQETAITKGKAVFITADERAYSINGKATIVRADVPL